MALTGQQVTVGTTATLIARGTASVLGSSVAVNNAGSVSVFIGGSTVTTGTGYELKNASATPLRLNLRRGEELYGIVAAATQRVDVLKNDDVE